MPQLFPARIPTIADVTPDTPGSAWSSSRSRSNRTWDRSGSYPFRIGDTANVTTLSVRRPRSTRLTFARLLMKRPATTRSITDSAICAVTSPVRNRAADRAPVVWPVLLFSDVTRSVRVACHAG